MTDLASLSDDQLLALYHGDFSKLSDDDLKALYAPADPVSVNSVARSAATGVPIVGGLLNKADAATNATLAPVLNGLFDDKDQLKGDWSERYAKSLADQEGADAKFASQHPVIDTGAKLAGGAAAMVPVVGAAPRLFGATGGFVSRVGAGAASNAVLGGADAAVRGGNPIAGAITGGMIGGAAPAVEAAASPFISNIMARINPRGFATRQVARGIAESGQTPQQLADAVTSAAAEGQPQFTLADAMGSPGQRLLSTVARAPGQGRTDVVNALESRQAGQGRRVANALAEGFDAPETAAQTEARLTAARNDAADAEYGAVRNDAQPVDLTNAIARIDQTLQPGVNAVANPASGLANDSIETALQQVRNRLTDGRSQLSDFTAAQRVRGDIADMVQSARQSGAGNRARILGGVLRELDASLERASPGFRQANANFSQASRDIDAIGQGQDAFNRGRTEDTIPSFQALRPPAQQAFRAGYVDPAIAQAQGAAFGVNKARPLINDAFQAEANAIAPGNDLMQRRIGREQTMFETRNQALGGSRTADNLNDHEAMGINPTLVGHVVTGNWGAAIGNMLHAGVRGFTGNTPAVRKAVADILLRNGTSLTSAQLNQTVGRTIAQLQFLQTLARSGTAAATVAPQATKKSRSSIFPNQRGMQ